MVESAWVAQTGPRVDQRTVPWAGREKLITKASLPRPRHLKVDWTLTLSLPTCTIAECSKQLGNCIDLTS